MPLFQILFSTSLALALSLKDYKLKCHDESDCSPSVGALFSSHGACTSFLVESDVVATNAHCVPKEMKVGDACATEVHFLYPPTGEFALEPMECQSLLSLSVPATDSWVKVPDYAFFRLTKATARPALKVSNVGVADNQVLTIRKVNFTAGQSAEIETVQCKGVQNSIYNAHFSADTSPVVALGACPIIPGNSGSPMLDAEGEVRAIVSAREVQSLNHDDGKRTITRGFGANFSCINLFFTRIGYGMSKNCINVTGQSTENQAIRELLAKATATLDVEMNARARQIYKDFVSDDKSPWVDWVLLPLTRGEDEVGPTGHPLGKIVGFMPRCWIAGGGAKKESPPQSFKTKALSLDLSADADGRIISALKEQVVNSTLKFIVRRGDHALFAFDFSRGERAMEHVNLDLPACE